MAYYLATQVIFDINILLIF